MITLIATTYLIFGNEAWLNLFKSKIVCCECADLCMEFCNVTISLVIYEGVKKLRSQ
jgi:hypothetical protein